MRIFSPVFPCDGETGEDSREETSSPRNDEILQRLTRIESLLRRMLDSQAPQA